MSSPKRLFLLDAYSIIYRMYFAFKKNPRITSKGVNTSAIFGFFSRLFDILEKENPDALAVVFDPIGGSFRHKEYSDYKAQRDATPEDIKWSVPEIKKILKEMNIPVVEVPNFEADDVIGALAKQGEQEGLEVFMVTTDKDYAQLVTPNCKIYRFDLKGKEVWGEKEVCEKFELKECTQIIDYLGLIGDAADNIPGCKGIGPKGASNLLSKYGSIDEIYNHLSELSPRIKKLLEEQKEQTLFSRYLVKICTDIDLPVSIKELQRKEIEIAKITPFFEEYELRSLFTRLLKLRGEAKKEEFSSDLIAEEQKEEVSESLSLKNIKTEQVNYQLIESEEERKKLWEYLKTVSSFAFDTETDGIDSLSCNIVGISFSTQKGEGFFLLLPNEKTLVRECLFPLVEIMKDTSVLKIAHNAKFDLEVLSRYGIEEVNHIFDTMIAHYLIAPELSHKLDILAENYLSYSTIKYEDLAPEKNFDLRKDVAKEVLKDYACEDADIAFQLYQIVNKEMDELGVKELFQEIEMPLVQVLQRMEERGIKLDVSRLQEVGSLLTGQLAGLQEKIFAIAGHPFNVGSPKQVGQVLFEELKISKKPRKTKSGAYATGEDVLQMYASYTPIVQYILEYRGVKKLQSTYVEALPLLLYPDGKLHSSFNQAVASTGRLSSSNPNLQNIPIKTSLGQEMRAAFVPESDEYCFLSADYSQVELRLLAHFSGDEHLIEAFVSGEDVHRKTAARIYKIEAEEVTPLQRSFAKTANFGIIYGISAFGLSQRLNIPPKEAQELIDNYFRSYPTIQNYIERSIAEARSKGYAETLLGRRRYLPDINSPSAAIRSFAERNAMNAPIQGTAADLIKIAMVRIDKAIKERGWKSRLILQVHDELNFDAHKDELEDLKQLVKQEMMSALGKLKVPLEVEMGVGNSWLEAH